MNRNVLLAIIAALILGFTAFKATIAGESSNGDEVKSLAWYVANIKEARAQNQECHDNPGIQSTPACVNALHALEISFKGGN
jgi:hypothetical protein